MAPPREIGVRLRSSSTTPLIQRATPPVTLASPLPNSVAARARDGDGRSIHRRKPISPQPHTLNQARTRRGVCFSHW